ncbi:MAG: RagB/SusD family nutrient uptake outer membrane protein [Bacteroidales bacterium]|nr:RagB/SusD family nutrient uptake outer membrane protein [Bacteroidales bacterium]
MRINNIIKNMVGKATHSISVGKLGLGALAVVALTSCQDWLTIYPQTQIVEENFWEDKNDLQGVRYAAYANMCGTLEKMVLWGDLRSDNYVLSVADQNTGTKNFYNELREGRIDRDSANTYFDWSGFYTTINFCNKVLYHGAEVLQKDKQFTPSEWSQMKAEITGLRALNYFYLLRSFKDVPYTTKVINKDTEVEYFKATNQLAVLDSIIVDVESVKGQATNRFSSVKDTKGLITNCALYAMLSDMYLWRASLHQGRAIESDTVVIRSAVNKANVANLTERNDSVFVIHTVEGDYQKCIEYADEAMKRLDEQNRLAHSNYGSNRDETENYGLEYCNMYKNKFEFFKEGGSVNLNAYNMIFTEGNSDESIFEMQFNNSDSRTNGVVTSQWGYGTGVHLAISESAIDAIYTGAKRQYDSRTWYSLTSNVARLGNENVTSSLPGLYCFKWRGASVNTPENGKVDDNNLKLNTSAEGESYRNWIVYRLSDVMLQKAEALACLSKKASDSYAQDALRIVNAIHRRWYCPDANYPQVPSTDVMNNDGYAYFTSATIAKTAGNICAPAAPDKSVQVVEVAVLNERQIEFIAEGKRWFDLVRFAERHAGGKDGTQDAREYTEQNPIGNGAAGVKLMLETFMGNTLQSNQVTSLRNHMKNRYGLYNLIYYKEIQASKDDKGVQHLEQNPVWNKSLYD